MNDRDYIEKETRILYKYILEDNEQFDNKKQLYARIYNNIKYTAKCDIGGFETLDLSVSEIKDIIKNVIENYKED
ncbi:MULTISPECIES: hypothetical protein [unclassified Clostridium]|jgi:hypothetical protein|uniref:hypothetical protein n=1 Tax=unclassified Clostridium TaxID=2614128 RepID=UPI0025E61CA6|nr:hypothetical protein [Clostridium sp.]MCI6693922.1 hypothetical protein [Clostridium sp.]MDY2629868.1 hypothetical protein [Clostridium sp.]MDY4253690.1 hypothetical protein [Clostridium sp.]MDY6227690.1 hypothetical protein [Clostridium sp.]